MTQPRKLPPSETSRELFDPIERSLGGPDYFIKNPLARLDKVFNLQKEQYIVIGSNSGTGKTAMLDHLMLSAIESKPDSIHLEVLYYSMERKKKFKFAKWVSWKMKVKENKRVSSDSIMNRNGKMNTAKLKHIRDNYASWLEETLDYIDLREGARTVDQIRMDIEKVARRLGNIYSTDSENLYKNGNLLKKLDHNKTVATKYGKRKYITLTINSIEYTLFENDSIFITPKPTIVYIIIDHIGKVLIEGNKKATLDRLDQVLSDARDKYSFSPIAVSQFNRGIGSADRQKLQKGDLSPSMEDFKDTGNITESADLVMSLFDPARYKSWNTQGEYRGYNIRDHTITPNGQQRARSLHVIKNSFGFDNVTLLLRFTGESMYFQSMPEVTDVLAMSRMYKEIADGK